MTPLAITGVGVVSPLGVGREALFAALRSPDQAQAFGVQPSKVLDPERYPEARVAEASDFDARDYLGKKGLRNFDRLTRFLIVAAKLALEDAGIKADGDFVAFSPEQVGLCSATAYGSVDELTETCRVAEMEDARYLNPSRFPNTVINAAAGYVSIWEQLSGVNTTIVDGNCGALDAYQCAATHIAARRAAALLVGGGESLSEAFYLAFRRLGVLAGASDTWAPAQPGSAGTRLGEGAAFMCAESTESAAARGARVLALVRGYGTSFDPPDSEALLAHPSARAVADAAELALEDAKLNPADIDLLCAGVSGIGDFDRAEIAGLEQVFSPALPIAAPKQRFGETLGAAGAMATAATLAWFEGAPIGPMVRGEQPSGAGVRRVLVSGLGFYGNASAVVLERPEAARG